MSSISGNVLRELRDVPQPASAEYLRTTREAETSVTFAINIIFVIDIILVINIIFVIDIIFINRNIIIRRIVVISVLSP